MIIMQFLSAGQVMSDQKYGYTPHDGKVRSSVQNTQRALKKWREWEPWDLQTSCFCRNQSLSQYPRNKRNGLERLLRDPRRIKSKICCNRSPFLTPSTAAFITGLGSGSLISFLGACNEVSDCFCTICNTKQHLFLVLLLRFAFLVTCIFLSFFVFLSLCFFFVFLASHWPCCWESLTLAGALAPPR